MAACIMLAISQQELYAEVMKIALVKLLTRPAELMDAATSKSLITNSQDLAQMIKSVHQIKTLTTYA
jgi:hypothetical protein